MTAWPTGPAAVDELADALMDARMDGPWWKPPSTLTYQAAMRRHAAALLAALAHSGPTVPCPDPETFRIHASAHRQQVDGSWTCDRCAEDVVDGRGQRVDATAERPHDPARPDPDDAGGPRRAELEATS